MYIYKYRGQTTETAGSISGMGYQKGFGKLEGIQRRAESLRSWIMSENKAELKVCIFSKLYFKNKEEIPSVYPQEICPNTYFFLFFFFF